MLSTDPVTADAVEAAARCKNCDTELSGRFCSHCGQREKHLDPSLHDLFHELVHEFLHLDGKIVKTLKALVLSPGQLTSEFLSGRRAKYIGPIRLYLTFSLLFFLIAAYKAEPVLVQGEEQGTGTAENKREFPALQLKIQNTGTTPDANSLGGRIESAVAKALRNREVFRHSFFANVSRVMFAIVPLFALGLRLAYRRRNRRYPAFVYFSLHYHAFAFLALTLYLLAALTNVSAVQWLVGYAVALCLPVYLFIALRRVYGGSRRNTLLRMAALAAFYLPCFGVGFLIAGVITLLTL